MIAGVFPTNICSSNPTGISKEFKAKEKRNINYEQKISTEYLEKIAASYSNYFHNQHKSNVLIVNNENIDLLEDSSALNMMVDRIMGITSIREYFNPQFIWRLWIN